MIALPPAYVRRKKLAHGLKILVQDNVDRLVVRCLDAESLKEIDQDNSERYGVSESKRLKVISKKYRQTKVNQKYHGGPEWQNKKL